MDELNKEAELFLSKFKPKPKLTLDEVLKRKRELFESLKPKPRRKIFGIF
jgi:hypothetical protein